MNLLNDQLEDLQNQEHDRPNLLLQPKQLSCGVLHQLLASLTLMLAYSRNQESHHKLTCYPDLIFALQDQDACKI